MKLKLILVRIHYKSELSCMEFGTGSEQNFERNIVNYYRNRFVISPSSQSHLED